MLVSSYSEMGDATTLAVWAKFAVAVDDTLGRKLEDDCSGRWMILCFSSVVPEESHIFVDPTSYVEVARCWRGVAVGNVAGSEWIMRISNRTACLHRELKVHCA